MDAQGPALALRYVQAARATYPVLLDADGVLSSLYGFQAIPNGWLIDAEGVIRFEHIGGFDIRKPQTAEAIERVLKGAAALRAEHESRGPRQEVSIAFQEGVRLLRQGKKRAALEAWLRAVEADPANFLARKQIWHLLYPQRFEPQIEFTWQREQMEREARLGIRAANPLPDDLT